MPYSRMSFRMTLSDLEWLSEILNDTKHRAPSLRQLSFLWPKATLFPYNLFISCYTLAVAVIVLHCAIVWHVRGQSLALLLLSIKSRRKAVGSAVALLMRRV